MTRSEGFKKRRVQGFEGSRVRVEKDRGLEGWEKRRVQGFKGSRVQVEKDRRLED
ncbi:MAG TPA: hypothetical protein PKH70_00590 [Syntrophorhabdaceae bacterium]|jgi:hypothetical protein|nr:hypothetical protein [Syntrophorhabdaceae bacterium]